MKMYKMHREKIDVHTRKSVTTEYGTKYESEGRVVRLQLVRLQTTSE